ncbi:MAG TPA: hypothetical protein VGM41_03855 [Chitinophagaceae bacterium]
MKKGLFLIAGLMSILATQAQIGGGDYKPFKVDVAFGAAIPSGSGSKGGVLFAIEPKYAVMPMLSVGLRIEGAVVARGFVSSDGQYASGSASAAASYLVTGDYYIPTGTPFRPFGGVGVGVYDIASASVDESSSSSSASYGASSKVGGLVRAGFEIGHFRLGLEYNLVGKTDITSVDGLGNSSTVSSKNSYMGVKIGFFIGGGKQ